MSKIKFLFLIWTTFVYCISYYGFTLFTFVRSLTVSTHFSIIVNAGLLTSAGLILFTSFKKLGFRHFFKILWIIPITIIALINTPIAQEKLHFILFSALGLIAWSAFKPWIAIILCIVIAISDECFQLIAPHRFFDVRDIIFNLVSVGAGLLLAYQINFATQGYTPRVFQTHPDQFE